MTNTPEPTLKPLHRPTSTDSVAYARMYVRHQSLADGGTTCPCCSRTVRPYRYQISRTQAQFMRGMARQSAQQHHRDGADADADLITRTTRWVDLRDVRGQFGDGMRLGGKYAHLRHWLLIEKRPGVRATWRLTPRAIEWMLGRVLIPRHVHVMDNALLGYGDDLVGYDDALGYAFDLADALQSPTGLGARRA